ncbi:MAG TPA: hypothetical protein VM266_01545 [Solirubrobacteraceae bacterium]|nr:hypothetical protein [Solirubrobacteraceae bacterium]
MSGLFGKVARFARSAQGQRAVRQATRYARSEKGRRQLTAARERLAARGSRKPPR